MTIDEIRDKVLALERRAEREDERHAYMEERLEILEKNQATVQEIRIMIERLSMGNDQTRQSFADLNHRLDTIDKKLADRISALDTRLDTHEKQPGEKWEKAKWAVFSLVLGGVAGYLINKLLV